tara:strand:+ start:28267 stop:28938 length:672 start_codon:yes stop_codon:yes gene_type:complete
MDWPLHKLLRSTFKDFSNDKRPIQNDALIYKRAIYFNEFDDCPRFVWLRVTNSGHNSVTVDLHCIPEHAVGAWEPLPKPLRTFKHNVFLQRELDGASTVMCRRGTRSGQPNKSLLTVDKALSDRIKTPVLALGFSDAEDLPPILPLDDRIRCASNPAVGTLDLEGQLDTSWLRKPSFGVLDVLYLRAQQASRITTSAARILLSGRMDSRLSSALCGRWLVMRI